MSTGLGLLTGIVVALFNYVANRTLWNYFSNLYVQGPLLIVPFVLIGLLASGFLLSKSSTPIGSGSEEIIAAYNDRETKLDERSFPLKMLAAIITIGLGGSAGQEGPSVYAGGIVGAWIWRKLGPLRLTRDDRQTLILAGAAAGIGAIFKAPLTGTIFALEVPYKDDLAHDALVPSLVASATSYVTLIAIDGPQPLFKFPAILSLSLTDIAISSLLGLLVGIAALGFIIVSKAVAKTISRASSRFYLKALIATCVLSAIGILSVWLFHRPYPLGISYDLVSLSLTPHTLARTLLALFAMKLIATSFTLGSTGVGGIFIPQIVMGASLGALFAEAFFPSSLSLLVAVGMASFLAAGYKTPLAAVAFVAETAGGPGYLIPSLVAAAIAYSISGEASVSDNQKLRNELDVKQIVHLTANDVMTTHVISVPAELSVLDFMEEYLYVYQYKSFPVVDKDGLLGRISLAQVRTVPREKWFETKVADACSKDIYPQYPDSKLQDALDLMHSKGLGIITIVDRSKPRRVVGIVSESDIIRALEEERLGLGG